MERQRDEIVYDKGDAFIDCWSTDRPGASENENGGDGDEDERKKIAFTVGSVPEGTGRGRTTRYEKRQVVEFQLIERPVPPEEHNEWRPHRE